MPHQAIPASPTAGRYGGVALRLDPVSQSPTHRRPLSRASLDGVPASGDTDPAAAVELAHTTAAAVLRAGRDPAMPAPVDLVERLGGLDELARLWSDAEEGTLPSTLLTLYLLREWCRSRGAEAARLYRDGAIRAEVSHAVAGVVAPPGPEDVARLADAVLTSTYRGDLAVALERAAAFSRVVGAGREVAAHDRAGDDPEHATRELRLAAGNTRAARALEQAARAWRAGTLV